MVDETKVPIERFFSNVTHSKLHLSVRGIGLHPVISCSNFTTRLTVAPSVLAVWPFDRHFEGKVMCRKDILLANMTIFIPIC